MKKEGLVQALPPGWPAYAAFAAVLLLAALFHLGPAVLAGLFSFALLDGVFRALSRVLPRFTARWLSLAIFLAALGLGLWLAVRLLKQSLTALPEIMERAMPRVQELAAAQGLDLPFEDMQDLRNLLGDWLKENMRNVSRLGGMLTREVFHALLGVFTAVLGFMTPARQDQGQNLYGVLSRGFSLRLSRFMASFQRVLGAQVLVSAINTGVTAAFLAYFGFPNAAFLILATFFLGLIPVVGNLVSNTIIVLTAITASPLLALISLVFLVLVHKGQYFLNSRIVGKSIHAPMWQVLVGILIGELLFGVPGIVLAPAMLHYVRGELRDIPWAGTGGRSL